MLTDGCGPLPAAQVVSEAAMRRPEEVFRAEAGGAAAGEAELSREERRRRRAKKKRAHKKRGAAEVRAACSTLVLSA